MTSKQGPSPAEVAAAVGTVEACWDSYRDHVVQAAGMPPDEVQYVNGARLDFYAGAASVFQILRSKFERGEPPGGHTLVELELEVATFLATAKPGPGHKAGHA